ncbi:hypothetical protein B0G80_5957 [Paraburkholderia sp. BL6669N2]|nr:hypothetical protein B0G80_5957 [Paraburkholderia sp. BL6669N2]
MDDAPGDPEPRGARRPRAKEAFSGETVAAWTTSGLDVRRFCPKQGSPVVPSDCGRQKLSTEESAEAHTACCQAKRGIYRFFSRAVFSKYVNTLHLRMLIVLATTSDRLARPASPPPRTL